jgi:TolB-like protein
VRRVAGLSALGVLVAIGAFLFWPTRPGPVADSLAVLPFKPLLPDARNPALQLGMADTLIVQLSSLPGVRVRPLSSVRPYDEVNQDPLAAGRALRVATVLDGSIHTDGERVRVSARLLQVADGRSLWSGQFEAPRSDIFSVQDAIAQQVVAALAVTLTAAAQQRLLRQSTANADAYQHYVSGLYHWQRRLPQAVEQFEAAVRLDRDYALAWSGLASALTAQGVFGHEAPAKVFPRAKEAALRAIALDGELAQARAALGHVLVQYERNLAEGERHYLAAIEKNGNDASFWHRLAIVRMYQGRLKNALADMQRAQELEPTTLHFGANIGMLLYLSRSYDAAEVQLRRVLALEARNDQALTLLGRVLLEKGDIAAALERFSARRHPTPGSEGDLGRVYARAGRSGEARAEIARLEQRGREGFGVAYDVASIHVALGEIPQACQALQRALDDHSQLVQQMRVDPALDRLRNAPCYAAVEGRLYGSRS